MEFRVTSADIFIAQPWTTRLDRSNGSMGEGLSHELDKARFLTGCEFTKIVSIVAPITIKQAGGFLVEGGRTFHLAELSHGLIGQFSLTVGPGQDRWNMILIGDEGSLAIPDAGTSLVRQRADDDEPVEVPISAEDRAPAGVDLLQHTWNRLVADFVRAVRGRDIEHEACRHLATLTDGLRIEEIISAARRSNQTRQMGDGQIRLIMRFDAPPSWPGEPPGGCTRGFQLIPAGGRSPAIPRPPVPTSPELGTQRLRTAPNDQLELSLSISGRHSVP
jgi:predicted dehydrogenase